MSILGLIGRKYRPVAVGIHDGTQWHVSVFSFAQGEWRLVEHRFQEGGNPFQVPPELIEWIVSHGAHRIRILIPSEPHELEMVLPEDTEPDEAQAAVSYEVSSRTGDEPDTMRVAMVRADRFRMGGGSSKILATVFDESILAGYRRICDNGKTRFEGLGSLELSLLNYHARLSPQTRCLLILPQSSFYVAPAAQMQPFVFQSVPLAFRCDERDRYADRYERFRRRQQTHEGLSVIVWASGTLDDERKNWIRECFGDDTEISFADLREHYASLSRHAAWGRDIGGLFNGAALIGMGQAPRDPHRSGTWTCLTVVGICALLLGWTCLQSHNQLLAAQLRQKDWAALVSERERLQNEADSKRTQRDQSKKIARELRNAQVLPFGLLPILDVLRRQMPMYTRLTRLYQTRVGSSSAATGKPLKNPRQKQRDNHSDSSPLPPPPGASGWNEIVLQGTTYSQQAITDLSRILSTALKDSGFQISPVQVERLDGANELAFEYHITPRLGMKR